MIILVSHGLFSKKHEQTWSRKIKKQRNYNK
jgi:hypothetical protein